jgi:hypothetical protein
LIVVFSDRPRHRSPEWLVLFVEEDSENGDAIRAVFACFEEAHIPADVPYSVERVGVNNASPPLSDLFRSSENLFAYYQRAVSDE